MISYRYAAFTLIELVMVIAIAGTIAVMVGAVMSRPLQGFVDLSRRAELVDLAAGALNRMVRDIRMAVPNSVRVTDTGQLELLRSPVSGRYRANLNGSTRSDPPACSASPCAIQILSPLSVQESNQIANMNWMVIYNIGGAGPGNDIWPPQDSTSSVITPKVTFGYAGGNLALTGEAIAGFGFRYASPQRRFYLADAVVGYRCAGGRIVRKEFSALSDAASYDYSDAALLVNNVHSCTFRYQPGNAMRGGLVTIELVLEQAGERISLLQQVHVDNAP
ncbi:type II secretion system protein [Pseudomonas stutzeri]|uniref:PulJ/GspJ family protein n=1 Tax=Stutzerimonas stutzeri TaxID=316 RepID=UPI00190D6FC4|nr:type II secretion system protein [Stutzerimonas stutzeri]MBK3866617.1 type II secretion system protein [Stutzerimonas stutzeri]